MKNNQLSQILKEQEISENRSSELLEAFGAPFEEAGAILAEYELIKVIDESDQQTMAEARSKRLALKKVRTTVENKRKELKESIVKQGRAIDSVARFVKEVIAPAEEYLQLQEDFAKIKATERETAQKLQRIERLSEWADSSLYNLDEMSDEQFEALLVVLKGQADQAAAAEERAVAERQAAEDAERERQVAAAAENERLKKEAQEKEAERQKELAAMKAQQEKERAIHEAAVAHERKAVEAERLQRETLERAERERLAKEAQEKEASQAAERAALLAPDKQKLAAFATAMAQIRNEKLPAVKTAAAQAIVNQIETDLLKIEGMIASRTEKL